MKPPPFAYHAPATLAEALDVLAAHGADAKVLAGGQSLIPLLNMRLAEPGHIVDINRVAGLDGVRIVGSEEDAQAPPGGRTGGKGVRVGALARHAAVERSAGVAAVQPLLPAALRHVAHPVIRNRGTVVGSLAHADPAAELPAVLAVLGGTVEAVSAAGRRTIPAADFFTGPLESALRPGELAEAAFFPALPPRTGVAFTETSRRHGDYALAGVAAVVGLDEDLRVSTARVGYLGVAATPLVLDLTPRARQAQDGRPPGAADWSGVAGYVRDHLDPEPDIHAGADYRRHLAGVLTERALRAATADALDRAQTPGVHDEAEW
ncbi:carbon monoxide dehydrogenase [Actinomadura rubrobrunea]|uniref:Carbon monoxide dehydrogenase n=1 Tax=Actinomadura rubrobrunea TaxID=115335 RepID=A0A9W6PTV9_9ACTN|nr:xanthine dehydrogenase family protein subunit M [Actinomadura rubrobrunea]GLW63116.1 carbon monoxide dehydrogenase [Actinomadura rubrobrunea]